MSRSATIIDHTVDDNNRFVNASDNDFYSIPDSLFLGASSLERMAFEDSLTKLTGTTGTIRKLC